MIYFLTSSFIRVPLENIKLIVFPYNRIGILPHISSEFDLDNFPHVTIYSDIFFIHCFAGILPHNIELSKYPVAPENAINTLLTSELRIYPTKEQEEMFALARRMEAEPHHEENEMEELPEDSLGADEVQSEINEEDDRKDETEI